MSSLAASNGGEPPRKNFQPSSPSSFSSLPVDIVLNILARVPKRYDPIVSCVSKNLRSLVQSPEIYKTRSLLGKDYLYICFMDETCCPEEEYWYKVRVRISSNEKSRTENLFESIDSYFPPEPCYVSPMVAVGSEIFFIPEYNTPSSSLWILDTRSGELRQGPSLLVKRKISCVGLVGGKIYVIEGCGDDHETPAERFDLKTQTWEAAPIPNATDIYMWTRAVKVSFDMKFCALSYFRGMITYDTRDGSCEGYDLPNDKWRGAGVCVIDNVLYVYFFRFGLMWYDSQLMLWRVVYGLDLGKTRCAGMAEYYGKLAFFWEKPSVACSESKEIWCMMIGLIRSKVCGIHATAEEASQLLSTVPQCYELSQCLSLSG